jgi:2,4-dienoyl-CoA reductase-like NADH-dependent reductase (Old Yellow Enzyme family)
MSLLLQPVTIKEVTFKNRIVMSPMCQYSATDGFANDWHMVHLGTRAVGGVGLVMFEATGVSPEGRISPNDLGIWKDEHIAPLHRIVKFIQSTGCVAGIQLAHAGRKASRQAPWEGGAKLNAQNGGWTTESPSAVPWSPSEEPPHAMDKSSIDKVIRDFADAAKRALEACFQVVEIHAAHGYLIHQFLSPLTNHRKDEYGGSFENRSRLLIEITREVRKVWPTHLPLFVRISATDWYENGWDIEEAVKLAGLLKNEGVDLIDTSSGGNIMQQNIKLGPGYQVPFSHEIKRETGIMTGAVGLITSPGQAEQILQEEKADLVFLGRELLRNPYFALQASIEFQEPLDWPVQYLRARPSLTVNS